MFPVCQATPQMPPRATPLSLHHPDEPALSTEPLTLAFRDEGAGSWASHTQGKVSPAELHLQPPSSLFYSLGTQEGCGTEKDGWLGADRAEIKADCPTGHRAFRHALCSVLEGQATNTVPSVQVFKVLRPEIN